MIIAHSIAVSMLGRLARLMSFNTKTLTFLLNVNVFFHFYLQTNVRSSYDEQTFGTSTDLYGRNSCVDILSLFTHRFWSVKLVVVFIYTLIGLSVFLQIILLIVVGESFIGRFAYLYIDRFISFFLGHRSIAFKIWSQSHSICGASQCLQLLSSKVPRLLVQQKV